MTDAMTNRRNRVTTFCRAMVLAATVTVVATVAGCAPRSSPAIEPARGRHQVVVDQRAPLSSGPLWFDLYLPADTRPAALIVVAHGFSRSKANMAGWGRQLADAGFIAAVPTLPKWSDHARNGESLNEFSSWLCEQSPYATRIRPDRLAMMGFSAGGLATLLAAADNPAVNVWIGLDPVDRNSLGANAAARLKARAVILLAEPSACNAHGNAANVVRALGSRCQTVHIPHAVHVDAEWPTTPAAELFCGRSDTQRRALFVEAALVALGPP